MSKACKTLAAILLLPACVGAVRTVGRVLLCSVEGRDAELIWIALLLGAVSWLAVFVLLPPPVRVYVFGHELTHALWSWAFGGEVKGFRVGARGGHVIITRDNFLIALAPYFFPVYLVMVVVVFCLGHWIWGWRHYMMVFHYLVGAAYAFHVCFTWEALLVRQTDVTQHGYLFSGVVILLGNILVLLVGVPLLTDRIGLVTVFRWWLLSIGGIIDWTVHLGS